MNNAVTFEVCLKCVCALTATQFRSEKSAHPSNRFKKIAVDISQKSCYRKLENVQTIMTD